MKSLFEIASSCMIIFMRINILRILATQTCDIIVMKIGYLTFGLALFAISIFCAIPDIPSSSIPTYPILLINLYHPQCTRCKKAIRQMNSLHELSSNRDYKVAQINCAQQSDFCDQLKTTYPKVFLYVEGRQIIYEGKITAKELDQWMQSLILLDLPKLTPQTLAEKQGKEAFLLIGGLNQSEKIQIGATKSAKRFIGIEFYEIQSSQKVFSLYVKDQEKRLDLKFPINTRLFAFELFHRTRDHVMSANKPEYLEYFRTQQDAEQLLILFDHHDQLSSDSAQALDKICFQLVLDVLCFRVQKQSEYYEEFIDKFIPFPDRSSIIYSKKSKQKAYIYRDEKFNQTQFKTFLKEAKSNKRDPDFDYIKESKDRMKSQNVLNIDDEAHDQIIKNTSIVFVEYYSPFFDNCSSFVSQYDTVGKHFKQLGSQIVIASLDGDEQIALADQQSVSVFPAFKVFIGGQGFHYEWEPTAESIIRYLTQITNAKLLAVPSVNDVKKPAVVISGIAPNSTLHKLSAFFNFLPIYQVPEQELKISLFKQNDIVQTFTGQVNLTSVLDWLYEQTGPAVVSLGDSKVPKKLKATMKKGEPILGLINKGKKGPVNSTVQLLTKYCKNKKDFVCGVANKGEDDYEQLVDWIRDSDETTNRLVWIDHKQVKCYILQQDIASLTEESIDAFINGIKDGSIKEHKRPKRVLDQEQEESGQIQQKQVTSQPTEQKLQNTDEL